ncbi:hypothetical protein CDD81_1417 [Ophiocordyceps australis]|uniref:2-dehydropantoate 2-reductase n=1 Tax=Ophiocordyceps australis TaxID=1399860 RepID=A0A2C5XVY8_9HYPO|nr:hypothetical protein CDD81_1417 [Ophiocordyceps australis]
MPSRHLQTLANNSHRPKWLAHIAGDGSSPPRLYAWTAANIPGSSGAHNREQRQEKDSRRIYILGIGNIGRLFASHLARLPDRPPITLILRRPELLTKWYSSHCQGLQIISPGGEGSQSKTTTHKTAFDVECWCETPPPQGPIDHPLPVNRLIVTTKAASALPAVDRLRRYLAPDSAVVMIHNGVSALWPPHGDEYLEQRYPNGGAPRFFAGVTSHALSSVGDFCSMHVAPSDSVIGPILPRGPNTDTEASCPCPEPWSTTQGLVPQIQAAKGLQFRTVPWRELWLLQLDKLVANTTINPLATVLRCRNGQLFENSHDDVIPLIMDRLLQETCHVIQALVSHPASASMVGPGGVEALKQRYTVRQMRHMVCDIGKRSAANTCSMLQDVQAGRLTEVSELNGWLLDTAARLGRIALPTHAALVDLVEDRVALSKAELARRLV